MKRSFVAPLVNLVLGCSLLVAAPALANDPLKELIDQEVPALKDGTRMALAAVEQAILDACKRRKFAATVVEPGLITARWENHGHSFEVSIPYTDSTYSIRYKDSVRMDYNPAKRRIDDAYNEYVDGLAEHIEAGLDDALGKLKKSQKIRKVARINPRYAV
ncbi:MAG TPA: hypothetical protein VFZ95_14510 [Steroidobacteraceae bacterium]